MLVTVSIANLCTDEFEFCEQLMNFNNRVINDHCSQSYGKNIMSVLRWVFYNNLIVIRLIYRNF